MNTVHGEIKFFKRKNILKKKLNLNKNQIKSNKILINFSKNIIFKNKIFEKKNSLKKIILNAKLIAYTLSYVYD